MRVALIIALVGLCVAAGHTEQRGENPPFLLGVLNRDGLAIPFAAYTGKRWVSSWPQDQRGEMPMTIDDVDRDWWGIGEKPASLDLWWNGTRTGEVAITSLSQVKVLCSARLGLRTIAEGVETLAEWRWLRLYGADLVQGYLFAPPGSPPPRPRNPVAGR